MIKVLFISASLAQNGTEMFMMNIIRNANSSNFHFDFLINSDEITDNRKEAEKLGCNIFVTPPRREGIIKSIIAYWNFFKCHAKDYNAVHWCGGNLSSIDSLIIAKYFQIPVRIIHAHSSSAVGIHNRVFHKINRRFIISLGTNFLACSSSAACFFYRNHPSIIIKNGIDVEKFSYDIDNRNNVRKELRIPSNAIVLGHVGRFDDNKNQSFLLRVFDEYHKINVNSHLLLVGNGVTINDIKDETQRLNLTGYIHFLGVRKDVNFIMQAMDCFVMPSKFEGLPFVLVEAQCSGLPCVISDSINNDVDLTGNLKFLSLNMPPKKWATIIYDIIREYKRGRTDNIITEKGFSIKSIVKYMESLYIGEIDQ